MNSKIAKCLVAIQLLISCFAFESFALTDSEAGAYLWKLINEARARPAKAIEAYDIDAERARSALGEDFDLENGLPPLAWNELLAASASGHNNDMIDRNYYGERKLQEEPSFNDRIVNSGYTPLFSEEGNGITAESLGLLSFYIYMDPLSAVETIFENMLRDELNPDPDPNLGYTKKIFSKEFTEIGISFISTIFSFAQYSNLNAYLVTADFAQPAETRTYILGNTYNLGENQPDSSTWDEDTTSDNYAERLLSYKGWSPENASGSFTLQVYDITKGWMNVEVFYYPLGSYQIEIPADTNTLYYICLYSDLQLAPLGCDLYIGTHVNRMVDFPIPYMAD